MPGKVRQVAALLLALVVAASSNYACAAGKQKSQAHAKPAAPSKGSGVKLTPLTAKFDFGPKPLTGNVEHSETVAPVATTLRAGATFNEKALVKKLDQDWYWIPSWRTGTWQCNTSRLEYEKNYLSGREWHPNENNMDHTLEYYGYQQDRKGSVWDFVGTPRVQVVDTQQWQEVQLIEKATPVYVSNKRMTKVYKGKVMRVDPYTKTILATQQLESLQTYEPSGPDLIKRTSSTKIFDENGQPTFLRQTVTYFVRTQPYRAINMYKGQNMRLSLKNFLIKSGLKGLT